MDQIQFIDSDDDEDANRDDDNDVSDDGLTARYEKQLVFLNGSIIYKM